MMVADAARLKDQEDGENGGGNSENAGGKVERRELKTKEDIKNYIKGLM